ncbi:MAG: CRISPR-associated protein Csn2-St [Lachnospiraceae bacterium]|nr:CRISPR-associated protein Csn2-St [Lachnospiraceae bacterium]
MIYSVSTRNINYDINVEKITQLCGQNVYKKNCIIDVISKYFSGEKYHEYEEVRNDNILIDGNVIGRKNKICYRISNINDLIYEISINKNSILSKYIKIQLNDFDSQFELEQIDNILTKLFSKLNYDIANSIGDIELTYRLSALWDMVQKTQVESIDGNYIENKSAFQLLQIFINIIKNIQSTNPESMILIFENIDHIISKKEYRDIISLCDLLTKEYDISFVFSTSLDGYVFVSEEVIEGINVINDEIFSFPELVHIQQYVNDNYPCYIELKEDDLICLLEKIIHDIGRKNYIMEDNELVVCKLINETLMISEHRKNNSNKAERDFLND